MSSDAAEAAMPPARLDIETAHMFWDSKPTPRKSGTPKYWMLMFDQPEVVTQVTLDVDQHCEHYIVCPGGRDANKQEISFIYSFDLAAEKWTALTFPEMNDPMFNMDAKVVELSDGTHQLVILSGQIAKGFSNVIQGYNFERAVIQEVRSLGEGAINFAGRPALTGEPMNRDGYVVHYQFTKNEQPFEVLLVAACGGGTTDLNYSNSPLNGTHGIGASWYSPSNYQAPNTTTWTGTTSSGQSTGGSIQHYISNDAIGSYYTRTNAMRGGYGGGAVADDAQSSGGGWYCSTTTAYSWSAGANTTGTTGTNRGGGSVSITTSAGDHIVTFCATPNQSAYSNLGRKLE